MSGERVAKWEREMDRCRCRPVDWAGRVHTDVSGEASVWVCSLSSHREAAEAWVLALTGKEPIFTPATPKAAKPVPAQPSLFGATS